MTPVKTRLIALVDFSLYSHALIELAGRWCEAAAADLVLVHRLPGLVGAMTENDARMRLIESQRKDALDKLKRWSDEKISPSTQVSFVVEDKNLLLMIAETLDEGTHDLIVVGIKGSGMLKRIVMGSVATHVINELNQTTIAVPERLCTAQLCNLNPRRLVVALTDKYPLNEPALNDFLATFEARIESLMFISVVGDNEDAETDSEILLDLATRYQKKIPAAHKLFKGQNAFEEIKPFLQSNSDTVLVVQKGSRTLTDQFFRKLFINQVVNDASIPMVVLPAQ